MASKQLRRSSYPRRRRPRGFLWTLLGLFTLGLLSVVLVSRRPVFLENAEPEGRQLDAVVQRDVWLARRAGHGRQSESYWPSSLVNDSDASFHAPRSRTYTSVTANGLLTSLPPTTASSRILLNTIAVESMIRADDSKISACL